MDKERVAQVLVDLQQACLDSLIGCVFEHLYELEKLIGVEKAWRLFIAIMDTIDDSNVFKSVYG